VAAIVQFPRYDPPTLAAKIRRKKHHGNQTMENFSGPAPSVLGHGRYDSNSPETQNPLFKPPNP
jgi:hypothetical protein